MKQFLLNLLLFTITLLPIGAIHATALATSSVSTEASQQARSFRAQEQETKGSFLQKFAQKRLVKKLKKAFDFSDDDGDLVAILSYLLTIGFVIALVLHFTGERTSLGGYHLAQALGTIIVNAILAIPFLFVSLLPFAGLIVAYILALLLFINVICGLIFAIQGKEKPVPFFGKLFEKKLLPLFE
jgi:uncharacterized membrane protein